MIEIINVNVPIEAFTEHDVDLQSLCVVIPNCAMVVKRRHTRNGESPIVTRTCPILYYRIGFHQNWLRKNNTTSGHPDQFVARQSIRVYSTKLVQIDTFYKSYVEDQFVYYFFIPLRLHLNRDKYAWSFIEIINQSSKSVFHLTNN